MDMREIVIDKVTVNIGVGTGGEALENAEKLLAELTGVKPVRTRAKKRNPVFKLRPGMEIGVKATLRNKVAEEFLKKTFASRKNIIPESAFDNTGNFSIGVREYIDFPGARYNPKIGMFGFDVCATLARRGYRVSRRKIAKSRVGKSHRIGKQEAMEFVKNKFGVTIEG